MDASSISKSPSCDKYTSSFLNQLQSEWNEFVLEISHSTPHDIPKCNLLESSPKRSTKEAFIESLNNFNQISDGNILIPVPLNLLKKIFSPSKWNTDNVLKNEFFTEIKENLNLTKLSGKKLQKLLSIDDSSEISDFPSPSLPKNFRNSAPARLLSKKKCKSQHQKENVQILTNFPEEKCNNLWKKVDSKQKNNLKVLNKEKISPIVAAKLPGKCLNSSPVVKNLSPPTVKTFSKDEENVDIVKAVTNNSQTNRYSTIYNVQLGERTDSSSLFYSFKGKKIISKPTIVCTYFNQMELSKIYQIVKKLGYFEIENHVSSRTTHLICGGSNKTINLCKAVVRGCWILDKEWVTSSDKENRWLLEERFEKKGLSPAVLENRLRRQKSGSTYRCDVFSTCGSMYVSKKCSQPNLKDLKELILLGGGSIEESPRKASYIIGSVPKYPYVKEIWILNCVLQGYLINVEKYYKNKL